MKFKSFLLSLSALLLLGVVKASACGGDDLYSGTMANLFVVTNPLDADETGINTIDESVDFWYAYLGGALDKSTLRETILYSRIEDYTAPEKSENALVKILVKRKDKIALAYLKINEQLYNLKNWAQNWDYQKPKIADYRALINQLARYTATPKLKDRFVYLRIRCLFCAEDYDAVEKEINLNINKVADANIKRRLEGYMGGVYFHRGQFAEALDVFYKIGDQRSIDRCVSRLLDPDKLESYYEKNPNSIVLLYVMQDYANYIYHANYNDGDDGEIWPQVRRDYAKMYDFARKVVREKKVKNPMVWQMFVGFLEFANHKCDNAFNSFAEAQKMGGTADHQDLARYLKLIAAFGMTNKPADFEDYILAEVKDMRELIDKKFSSEDEEMPGPLWNIYNYQLPEALYAYCVAQNNWQAQMLTLALFGMVPIDGMYESYWSVVDGKLSTDQLIGFLNKLQKPDKKDKLSYGLTQLVSINATTSMNELIGTKYIREGNYDKAIEYLKNVPATFYANTGLGCYLNLRKVPEEVDFARYDTNNLEGDDVPEYRQTKLEFAIRMRDNHKRLKSLKGDERAKLAYQMAKEVFHASPAGDLWAITEYGWSSADVPYNNMNNQAVVLLNTAAQSTKDFDLLKKIYIGLASVPQEDSRGVVYNYETETSSLIISASQRMGYEWLRVSLSPDDEWARSCDVFQFYCHNEE